MPEFVITRKRMEKYDRRAVPSNFIEDLGVVAAQGGQGVRSQVSGLRCQVSGVRCQVSGYQRRGIF
jgi:hypothetical protein